MIVWQLLLVVMPILGLVMAKWLLGYAFQVPALGWEKMILK
jgi:hypothetical protein